MDNTQNGMNPQPMNTNQTQTMGDQTQPASANPGMDQAAQAVPSMGDLAGMTPPPPAPVMQDMSMQSPAQMPEPAPVAPLMMDTTAQNASAPASPMSDMNAGAMSMQQQMPVTTDATSVASTMHPTMPASAPSAEPADEYAYAEDLLDEILDSLDRIEAKLEAIEKKVGQ